jgi:hypothetical protein
MEYSHPLSREWLWGREPPGLSSHACGASAFLERLRALLCRGPAGYIPLQYTRMEYSHPLSREGPWGRTPPGLSPRDWARPLSLNDCVRSFAVGSPAIFRCSILPWNIATRFREKGLGAANRLDFRQATGRIRFPCRFREAFPDTVRVAGIHTTGQSAPRTRVSIRDRGDSGRMQRRFAQTLARCDAFRPRSDS